MRSRLSTSNIILSSATSINLPIRPVLASRVRLTQGWSLSGITRFASGFPVTMINNGDNSLIGTNPNGVNNSSIDEPDYNGGPLHLNAIPRANGNNYFDTAAFSMNALGSPGTQSAGSFTARARTTTIWQSPRTFRSLIRSRCSFASKPSTSSTTPSSTAQADRWQYRQLDIRERHRCGASAHFAGIREIQFLKTP